MNFLKLKHLGILAVLALSSCCYWWSNIQEIDSLKQAQTALDKANSNTLIVFDVDGTLTDQKLDRFMHVTDEGKQFLKELKDHATTKEDPKAYLGNIHAQKLINFTDQPVEPMTVATIKQLQDRGIKVIALTHCRTGGAGKGLIPSLPKWRWGKLKEVGIDFSDSFPEQEIVFSELTAEFGRHPIFYKGILLTDDFSKGEVLGAFLDRIDLKPSKVIFFDDRPDYVESVQQEIKKRGISFQGFIYKGLDKVPFDYEPAVLEKILQHIKEHDEFISDEHARKLLSKTARQ